MKKLILLELFFLFIATTFRSDNPPGWFQQQLPVNGDMRDVFFLDSLNGWVVLSTGYILKTNNGGNNWVVQEDSAGSLYAVQFLDSQTGYVLGIGSNSGVIYKSTNGGTNWCLFHNFSPAGLFVDMSFINRDTGWVASRDPFDGGVFRTTDGGLTWVRQVSYFGENPFTVFFYNKDKGWITNNSRKVYATTDGGTSWNLIFISPNGIGSVYFINEDTGWLGAAPIFRTTNGGSNWVASKSEIGAGKLHFVSDSIGWGGVDFLVVPKTTDGGVTWFYQNSPINSNENITAFDNLNAWSGRLGLAHTTDGGGISSITSNAELVADYFSLDQNFPNPFNPDTKIHYELKVKGKVTLSIYNSAGVLIKTIVDEFQNPSAYSVSFDGSDLPSGIYFYRLDFVGIKSTEFYNESRKMMLIK